MNRPSVPPEPAPLSASSDARLAPTPAWPPDEGREGSLLALVWRIARKWWLILAVAVAATVVAYLWMERTQAEYTARMIIAPTEPPGKGLGGALSALSTAVGQLGLEVPQAPTQPIFIEFQQVLTSVTLAERLQARYGLLQRMNPSRWDAASGEWLPPRGLMARLQGFLRTLVGQPAWVAPSAATLAGFLTRELSVMDPTGVGMFVVEFSHPDPAFAAELVGMVHREADTVIKERTIERSLEQIEYLKARLAETTLLEHRYTLLALLVFEERNVLLASSDLPFAAKIVDKVSVSDLPTYPEPFKVFAIAILGGVFLTVFGIVVVDVVRYA